MSPQKRGDEYPEKEFSSENGAWADDERFDDDVLDQGNSKVDISGYPLSKIEAQPGKQRNERLQDVDVLVQTALMECYNG